MKKAIIKLYIEKKVAPLFIAEIYENVEETVNKLLADLNDRTLYVITFGNLTFKKELFRMLKVEYK